MHKMMTPAPTHSILNDTFQTDPCMDSEKLEVQSQHKVIARSKLYISHANRAAPKLSLGSLCQGL